MSGAGAATQAWRDSVAACVIGAERAGGLLLPEPLDGLAAEHGPDGLLQAVAALGVWRMAGVLPDPTAATPVPPMVETLPECSDASAARLEFILSDRGQRPPLCLEWCRLAAAAGVRAPPGLAQALFAYGRRFDWAAEADKVLGARLPWLLGLDGAGPPAEPTEADWSSPDLARRVAALRLMRADSPAAREALAAVWKTEAADVRARLVSALQAGLNQGDEPFLEGCLDDRSAQVRAEAVHLLARLPGSRYTLRMQGRARAAVQFKPGKFLSRDTLAVTLPAPDDAARRDGLDAKALDAKALDAKGVGGPGASLLRQLAAAAPLASWEGAAPERWIRAALAGDWAAALLRGWGAAALRERDAAWLTALLETLVQTGTVPRDKPWLLESLRDLAGAVPPAELEALVLACLQPQGSPMQDMLFSACQHAWSPDFTAAALAWLGRALRASHEHGFNYHLADIGLYADPGTAAGLVAALLRAEITAAPGVPVSGMHDAVTKLAETLAFRAAMHQEFAR